jgi:hypothetical protein
LKPSIVHFQNPLRPNLLRGELPYFAEWAAYGDEVASIELNNAKRIGYFMFIYFEYYFVITLLARSIASYRWKTFITGILLCPHSLLKYLQYLLSPDRYRFRIWKQLSESRKKNLQGSAWLTSSP